MLKQLGDRGSDPAELFEIYRIDYKPESYEDFFNSLLQTVTSDNSAGASFLDRLIQNKKYKLNYHPLQRIMGDENEKENVIEHD